MTTYRVTILYRDADEKLRVFEHVRAVDTVMAYRLILGHAWTQFAKHATGSGHLSEDDHLHSAVERIEIQRSVSGVGVSEN